MGKRERGEKKRLSEVKIAIGVEIYPDVFSDMPTFDLFGHIGTDAIDKGYAVIPDFYVERGRGLIDEVRGFHEIRTCGKDTKISGIKCVKELKSFLGTPDIFVGRFFDRTDVCF